MGSTSKNRFQIRIVQQKIHNIKEKRPFLYALKGKYYLTVFYIFNNCNICLSLTIFHVSRAAT